MIIDEINKANINALKNKDENAKVILGILKNKYLLASIEKRTTGTEMKDEDFVPILLKTVKELIEEKENYEKVGNTAQAEVIEQQKIVVEKFIPKMMSVDEIKEEILKLEDKSMPNVMKHFKINFNGKCEMSLVREILGKIN